MSAGFGNYPVPKDPVSAVWDPDAVVDAIIAYMDTDTPATDRPAGFRTNKGLAYLGEIYAATYNAANTPGANTTDDHKLPGAGGTVVDFLSNPSDTTADGIIDDCEEQTMPMRWLSQVGAVRSDIYTAYILVRGYAGTTLKT